MKTVRDWVFSQLLYKSLVSSGPISGSGNFYDEGHQGEEHVDQGSAHSASLIVSPDPSNLLDLSSGNQSSQHTSTPHQLSGTALRQYQHSTNGRRKDPLAKIEDLQVKFFRLLQRFGQSEENLFVAKVLYRMHLATVICAEESDLKRVIHSSKRAQEIATQQESSGLPELDFSCTILVLGRTGVGKSATINSIFDETKTVTDAFQPATNCIQEFVGTLNGITVRVIDTPGLLPSSTCNVKRNKRILHSIKRFIRKSPPDVVLYFERLDFINAGYSDTPLLRLITEVFGSAIWFNTILVMTHSSSAILEGHDGKIVNFDSFVSQCTDLMQHNINQALSDTRLENPVLLVENHPQCPRNFMGEKSLPNGQVWVSQLLLCCICTKVLGDVNFLLKFQDTVELGPGRGARIPSLPHLVSALLNRSVSNPSGMDHETDEILLSDIEEEDEYDQLPPIRILSKAQFGKLSKLQKKEYLDELDYRETLYLKKHLKEDSRRRREEMLLKEQNLSDSEHPDDQQASPEPVLLPDMDLPPSFDSGWPLHRYRCLVMTDQSLSRPVLNGHGWDHDVGFDGINLEIATKLKKDVFAVVTGQMNKDKQDFSIQSECSATYVKPKGPTYSIGVDVQSADRDLVCTVHSNTKFRSIKHNIAECGFCITSYAKKHYLGAKIEDTMLIGKRLKFVMNAGQMVGAGQVAYGGTFEAAVRGRDYPIRNDNFSLKMTVLSLNKETVLSGSLKSEFRLNRSIKASVSASLNNHKMGQICIKTSSSEHLQIALVAVFSIFKMLLRRKATEKFGKQTTDVG
ncbi:translocase of chloroplast 90, chloroplastic-like isoform X1 [Neltuma alba]|uniref:translocase of chloroplast 90, chloroplastic-like isoform X1 n=1 Tax=Neltuma alba TaxID=207710 RepID=UPI0010A3B96D|nr:translocase of chloroplast 90, chloroplastic-like isoform X1 [Prosopis alba]XP_028760752.1 translocase of chloroplast 90, chloroplastic-like isoform X1 [Prosopis alba]XP_028760753.1 translocase of chloroplast 90, chloroplastic-like isoform X1 [Prosopis alba]XP_028760754.1 translocase of chloroplast 90, chloroplastic-like isoform X1 [Prosopis alba]